MTFWLFLNNEKKSNSWSYPMLFASDPRGFQALLAPRYKCSHRWKNLKMLVMLLLHPNKQLSGNIQPIYWSFSHATCKTWLWSWVALVAQITKTRITNVHRTKSRTDASCVANLGTNVLGFFWKTLGLIHRLPGWFPPAPSTWTHRGPVVHRGATHWLAVTGDTPAVTCQSMALDLQRQKGKPHQ